MATRSSSRSTRTLLALAAALVLQTREAASQVSPVLDYTPEERNAVFKSPNASALVDIPDPSGFNLMTPWPGVPVDGWQLAIDIKADVPVKIVEDNYVTMTRLKYVPPDTVLDVKTNSSGQFAAMDGSWYPCMHLWVSPVLKAAEDEEDDPVAPDCSSHLPADCIRDLHDMMASGFQNWRLPSQDEHCSLTEVPESCEGAMSSEEEGEAVGKGRELMDEGLDYLPLHQWFFTDPKTHDLGDSSYYLRSLRRVWIAGIAWGYSANSPYAEGNMRLNTTLACIRARSRTKIPEDPTGILDGLEPDGQEGGVAQNLPAMRWTCLAFVVAVALALGF